ncbi:hypothetical protein BKI52_42115 [marine bacterium AO1-C]|nr:hypothetical protein BKI52_42115 [marine bacterium AO1-C]
MKIIGLLLGSLFSFASLAQIPLTPQQIQQDYQIFKNVLTQGHPSLYVYTSEADWEQIFERFEQEEIKTIKTASDLFKAFSRLANYVKDGHFRVLPPTMEKVPPLFPIWVKIINEKLYADTDDLGIPVGAELVTINKVEGKELLQRLMKYPTTDGYNRTKKYRQIENEFGILYLYEFGYQKDFEVIYKTPDGSVKNRTIPSKSFQSIGKRYRQRNSLFKEYRHLVGKKRPKDPRLPYVYFIPNTKTAVLAVNSFALEPKAFKSRLIALQKQIRKKRAKNLIIDVRQNIGGYRANAITLFSYVSSTPFKQRTSESIITQELPESQYAVHTMSDYAKFVKMYFGPAKKLDERWVLTVDRAEPMMQPQKKRFKGKVCVLIGGRTFSAGVAFALSAKNDANIPLIGEETGGGYYMHTGQYPVLYKLPHSRIFVNMSLVQINKFVKDKTAPLGSGVLPDHAIELTREDLIKSKDTQLNYALQLIQGKK